MSRSRVTGLALVALLGALLLPVAPALGKPEAIVAMPPELRQRLLVFTNGKGRFLIVPHVEARMRRLQRAKLDPLVFFGDTRRVYQLDAQHVVKPTGLLTYLREFRVVQGKFSWLAGHAKLNCGEGDIPLQALTAAQSQRFLQKVSFRPHYWQHEPHLFARDDEGRYYYVDRARTGTFRKRFVPRTQQRGFRLFIGRRGRAKLVKLRDAVVDDAGQIFLTAKGALHLDKRGLFWRVGKVRTPLLAVPMHSDAMRLLIHKQLGAYAAVRFHTPCDEL